MTVKFTTIKLTPEAKAALDVSTKHIIENVPEPTEEEKNEAALMEVRKVKQEIKELDALAERIIALPDKDRSYLWERLMKKLCGTCGSVVDGACWSCYDSREYD